MSIILILSLSHLVLGYGDLTPKTSEAKLFYIFYCIVGIPLMFWYLALCGQIQTGIYERLLKSMRSCLWHQDGATHRSIGPFLISSLVLVIFWFIGSVVLHKTTSLSLLDCLYYWFSTFTTTGFGDILLAGQVGSSTCYAWMLYKWLLLNLVFALIQSAFVWIHGFSDVKQTMCCVCWQTDHRDDASTVTRYNLELVKRQEFLQLHRPTQF